METKKRLQFTIFNFFIISLFFFNLACKKTEKYDTKAIPSTLTNIQVKNLPGGVEVTYDESTDKNVMLVTAEYTTDAGGREIKRFGVDKNNRGFTLLGLSTTITKLTLYTVSHSGVQSKEIDIQIAPILSPTLQYLQNVLASIEFVGIPTGVAYNFDNPERKDLTFVMEVKGDDGKWVKFVSEKISEESGSYPYYGFQHEEVQMTILYSDNSEGSNPKTFVVNALVEEELNKSTWTKVELPIDNWSGMYAGSSYAMESLWDKLSPTVTSPRFENQNQPLPHSFTIDLGASQAKALSKIKIYHFSNSLANTYGQYNPKTIEIYGSNSPGSDGGWTNWTKISTCISKMPSAGTSPTTADLDYLRKGEDYRFPLNTPAYRYIRFKVLDTWKKRMGESTSIRLAEITLFGVEQ